MKSKSVLLILAFLSFLFGFLTLVLTLLGLEFPLLSWIDDLPGLMPLFLKLAMMFGGIILAYLTATDWKKQD
ncbi:MAG: hypothetical protein SH818_10100 [Saprospiraceae bacterium]|nr:hypothetical protein [Saprospiraceae bacterium]